jgi:hypothetical protein
MFSFPSKHRIIENVDANFAELSLEIFNWKVVTIKIKSYVLRRLQKTKQKIKPNGICNNAFRLNFELGMPITLNANENKKTN